MATTILPFVIRQRPSAHARATGGQAKIIIFPGVRYESFAERDDTGGAKSGHGAVRNKRKGKAR